MSIKNRKKSLDKFKLKSLDRNTIGGSGNGRRSGKERRKSQSKKYFLNGGDERRSWIERRHLWYQTM
jgi:hypothetical protein